MQNCVISSVLAYAAQMHDNTTLIIIFAGKLMYMQNVCLDDLI